MELTLIHNSATSNPADCKIFSDRTDSLSIVGFALSCTNMCIRSAFHISNKWVVGAGGTLISVVVFIAVYAALHLLVQVAAYTRQPLLASMWAVVFGKRLSIIWPLLSVILACVRVTLILTDVVQGVTWLLERLFGEVPRWLMNPMIIGFLAWLVFIVPPLFISSLQSAVTVSLCAIILVTFVAFHQTFYFVAHVYSDGFDPEGRTVFILLNGRLFGAIANACSGYELAPLTWPGLRHVRASTPRRLIRAFSTGLIFGLIIRNLLGLIPYFTFFDQIAPLAMQRDSGQRIDVVIQCIAKVGVELLTLGLVVNSGRYSLCNLVKQSDEIPSEVWVTTGLAIGLIGVVLVEQGQIVAVIVNAVNGIGTVTLLYIVPGSMFLKIFGTRRLLMSIVAGVVVLFGLCAIACAIYGAVYTATQ
jgi:hypothetical protein